NQRLRRIEPARDADDELLEPGRRETLRQALYLDVVGLVAIIREHRRIGRHERKALDPAAKVESTRWRGEIEFDAAKRRRRLPVQPRIIAEGVHAHALLPDAPDIDIGDRHLRCRAEPLGLGQHVADLEDAGLPIPGKIGCRLPGAGGGIGIGREATRRLRSAEKPPHLRLADDDVAGRQVEQDLGARRRTLRAWRLRHPQIFTDLDMKAEGVRTARREQEIDAERRLLSGERHRRATHALARGKMPALVELTVIRQEHLWYDAEQPAAMERDAGIIEASPPAQPAAA